MNSLRDMELKEATEDQLKRGLHRLRERIKEYEKELGRREMDRVENEQLQRKVE